MTHIHTRPIRLLIVSRVFFGAGGCADSTGPGHIEDRGVLLVPAGKNGGDLVWTRDGTEVVFVSSAVATAAHSAGANILNAVSVSTHEVRQLNESQFIFTVARGSAGERIYFAADVGLNDGNFRVSRVHPASGVLEILTSIPLGTENAIVVSADERFLAVGSGLYDLPTAIRMSLPAGQPIGFSPDGTQLLYYQDQVGTSVPMPTLISTADRSSQPLHSTGNFPLAHRWEGNSPQLLKADFEYTGGNTYTVRLSEIDGVTGMTRDIAQFGETNGVGPSAGTWSPDGRTLGIWIEQGSIEKRTDRTTLYFIRAGSAPTIVASVHSYPEPPVFSPDGNSIAYLYQNTDSTHSVYVASRN
jgi:hypothetical protein